MPEAASREIIQLITRFPNYSINSEFNKAYAFSL